MTITGVIADYLYHHPWLTVLTFLFVVACLTGCVQSLIKSWGAWTYMKNLPRR